MNNCPQQVSAPKDRHNSETLFKFSEEDNILSESGGPEGGANEDETDRYAHSNHFHGYEMDFFQKQLIMAVFLVVPWVHQSCSCVEFQMSCHVRGGVMKRCKII